MKKLILFALVLLLPAITSAQFVITQYRVTRTAPGQTASTYVFQKASATCNVLPSAVPTVGPLVSFDDEANAGRSCFLQSAGNWSNLPPGIPWSFTIAAAQADGQFSAESTPVIVGRPGAPTNFGLRPTFTGVAFNGTVIQRFPFLLGGGQIDVATSRLDDNAAIAHLGLTSLSWPGFEVRAGDRMQIAIWR